MKYEMCCVFCFAGFVTLFYLGIKGVFTDLTPKNWT
jgi:hypothetical protein